jgi:glutamyl-tRNA reductase
MARRHTEVPKAEAIIAEFEEEFYNWLHMYKHTPAIRLFKKHLSEWTSQNGCEFANQQGLQSKELQDLMHDTINDLVVNLKHRAEKGCYVIEAYQQFLNHPAVGLSAS